MTLLAAPLETPALLARAATLHAELEEVCAESRALIERGRVCRLTSIYSRVRPIHGGSDLPLVMDVISEAALCLECIAKKTGLQRVAVDDLLKRLAEIVWLRIRPRRCDGCLQSRTTFGIARNEQP